MEEWNRQTTEMARLELYRQVKDTIGMEKYLQYDSRKVRTSFTKFQISDHNLRVEGDRWKKKKRRHRDKTESTEDVTLGK